MLVFRGVYAELEIHIILPRPDQRHPQRPETLWLDQREGGEIAADFS